MTVVSKKLRESAGHPDAHCMVNVAGVCGDDTEAKTAGCMLAHWRFSGNAGGGQKPDDFCGGFACGPCHTVMDSNGTARGIKRGSDEWLFYAFRATVRTIRWWHAHGLLWIDGEK